MLGNHHDAWVFGGLDPSNGRAALTEIVRVLGIGLQQGKTIFHIELLFFRSYLHRRT